MNTLSPWDEQAYKSTNLLSVLLTDERLTNKFVKFGNLDDVSTADLDFGPMNVLLDAGMTDMAVGHAETWYYTLVLRPRVCLFICACVFITNIYLYILVSVHIHNGVLYAVL